MWANNIRFFAVFAVIILHVSSGFVNGINVLDPLYGTADWWSGNIFGAISRWCVPVFVMISGYFLLCKNEDNKVFFLKE